MITTEGKNHFRRYLAGYVPAIAQSVCFGVGSRAEALSDTALHIEVTKAPINLVYPDMVNNKLVYKASIPEEYVGKVYEMGLYSQGVEYTNGEFSSRLISTFDSATEDWVDSTSGVLGTYVSTNSRAGADALSHTPALNITQSSSLRNISLDLSGYSSSDSFTFGFYVGNTNTNNLTYRFKTDANNYYSFAMGGLAQTVGYKVAELAKSTATVNGAPNWNNITELEVLTQSKATGTSAIELDVIRIEDKDTINLDYILVARKVLATPITKVQGQSQDIEFTLDIAI